MNFRSLLLALLCAIQSDSVLFAEQEDQTLPRGYREVGEDKAEAIKELCVATANTGLFSGAVLVAEKGEVLYQGAFGLANREWEIPNTVDTKFRLASVSKQFCAVLILQLAQEGRIGLDDVITDHLPWYRADTGDRITIHHLLSHQSGIKDYTASYDYRSTISRLPFQKDEFIKIYCSDDLIHEPGTLYAYCNAGYSILGRIIEKVTRKSFETNLQERIFTPLRMNESGYDRNSKILEKRASGYTRGIFEYTNADYLDMDSSPGAAGALYSTIGDMFRWDRALYTDLLLNEKYRRLMFTPNRDVPEVKAAGGRPQSRYGYGWQIYTTSHPVTKRRTKVVNHGGAISGFRAMEHRLVEEDAFVILLCNQGDDFGKSDVWNAVTRLGRELIHLVTDQPYRLPGAPPVSQELRIYQIVQEQDADAAIAWFKDNGKPSAWGGSTIAVSEKLLEEGKVEAGLQLMDFEVEQSPGKVWILRKATETFLRYGEPEKAMRVAQLALERKPEDERLLGLLNDAKEDLKRK